MSFIKVLDDNTINKIAAGEVVEKPMAVVKELVENAIDAGSSAITVEIKSGGIEFIRVTDNGKGIKQDELRLAFERHATSKITTIDDLGTLSSLGFRGEALASIAAVSKVECITKQHSQMTGIRYEINGGIEESFKEIGCPDGTTFVIRNIFYNTPARRKFLKTPATEGSYISDLIEKFALSHPEISFKFINNGQLKLQTSGNNSLKDVIYNIYGRDITANLVEFECDSEYIKAKGYIAKPVVSRGNRSYMSYFVGGRYIKSPIIYRAIEEGYSGYKMSHKYPFAVLNIEIPANKVDVNVHPSKMEVRFSQGDEIYSVLCNNIRNTLRNISVVPVVTPKEATPKETTPSERTVIQAGQPVPLDTPVKSIIKPPEPFEVKRAIKEDINMVKSPEIPYIQESKQATVENQKELKPVQESLFDFDGMKEEKKKDYRIVGCVFSTYWIIEYHDEMYIMDQHAAHEKSLYEKFVKKMNIGEIASQPVSPPVILTLSKQEADIISSHEKELNSLGFEISHFGGNEYAISSVPADLPGISSEAVLMDWINSLVMDNISYSSETAFMEKIASMSCKAAVKGGRHITEREALELVNELFELENPFHCPHGRPTMIKMTRYEVEKMFGRIV